MEKVPCGRALSNAQLIRACEPAGLRDWTRVERGATVRVVTQQQVELVVRD